MTMDAPWTDDLKLALQQSNARVLLRGDELFDETVTLFNQAVVSPAVAIVRVLTASDVSAVVLFAKQHALSLSVKGGGFNTAGWAVQGAIIVDLCEMDSIGIAVPEEGTGIINVQPFDSNFTKAFCPTTSDPAKKRREQEAFGGEAGDAEDGRHSNKVWSGASEGVDVLRDQVAALVRPTEARSPLTLDNLPLPVRTTRSSVDPQASASRPNSRASSSLDSGVHTRLASGASEDPQASGGWSSLGLDNIKGKGRAADQEMDTSEAPLAPLRSEGTRSWVANQTQSSYKLDEQRRPSLGAELAFAHHPSYATSFSTRRLSAPNVPLAFSSFGAMAGLPGGINSNAFSFDPSAMAPPNSSGFVFNTAALASASSLARPSLAIPLPPAPPTIAIPATETTNSSHSSFVASSHDASTDLSPTSASSSLPSSTSTSLSIAALVTIGAGAKSRSIDAATAPYSFHVPLAAYPVGCAIFASGGFGFLSRLHGLSMDNVTEAELVLMDGRIMHLSSEDEREEQADESEEVKEKRDLWWAFRGAGITIGIVTRIRVKAFKVGLVYSGNLIYPFNPATTPSLIKHWRDCCTNAPRELYMNLILTAGPNPASHVVVIQLCYLGARSVGDQFLQNMMSWEGERCLLKDVETRTFLTQQDSVSQVLSAQPGNRWCIRANLMNSLPDECIHKTVALFKNIPERSAWLFEIAAGAIADPDPTSSCFPLSHRVAPFQVAALHQWKSSDQDDRWTTSARDWINNVISPYSPGGSYPCFLESKEGWEKVRDTFGNDNWERLVGMKRRWDPQNQLMNNFWPNDLAVSS